MISVFLRYRRQYYATKFHNEHPKMPSPAYVVHTTDQGTVRTCSLSALRCQQQAVGSIERIFRLFSTTAGLNLKMAQFVHVRVLATLSKNYCSDPTFKWLHSHSKKILPRYRISIGQSLKNNQIHLNKVQMDNTKLIPFTCNSAT